MSVDASTSGGTAPGWYGKLSTLGDFASRRLPAAAQRSLDAWLSELVDGSRRELGGDWLQAYLDSPLQRFVLGPGLLDAAAGRPWWFGILMPSCDSVGRYFPLVVLQPRSAPPSDGMGFDHLEQWWQRAGEAALETLSDNVDVERFDRALAELPSWPEAHEVAGWATALAAPADRAPSPAELCLPPAITAGELAQGMAAAGWSRRLHGHSLWWTWRPQGGETACRVVAGLPGAPEFCAMLGWTA